MTPSSTKTTPSTSGGVTSPERVIEVEPVAFVDVSQWTSSAGSERSSVTDTKRTRWFVVKMDGIAVGCAGLIERGGGVKRIKGVYVVQAFRGQGCGELLARHLLALADDECASAIEAFAWNQSFYEGLGFTRIGTNAHGAANMRRLL